MAQRPSPTLENAVEPGVRVTRIEPLAIRIERNRRRFVGFMIAFTSGIALTATLTVGFGASVVVLFVMMLNDEVMWLGIVDGPVDFIALAAALSFGISLALAWAWSLYRLSRSELTLVRRLGAQIPKAGTLLPTKSALHDMAIAAGLPQVPMFYVIDTPRVNAFVLGRSPEKVRIGVTSGMLQRITVDEQRGVFANLIARVISYDTLWATAVSALMGPIVAMREYDMTFETSRFEVRDEDGNHVGDRDADWRVMWLFTYGLAVVLTEVLSWYHREAAWRAAEKADAEGMMLLKDPRSMVNAIQHVLDRDNYVPSAGDAYSLLFFCWAGYGFAPEDDPEMRRVARLRETLGAEGSAYLPRPNVPNWPHAPEAPRVELLEDVLDDEAAREA